MYIRSAQILRRHWTCAFTYINTCYVQNTPLNGMRPLPPAGFLPAGSPNKSSSGSDSSSMMTSTDFSTPPVRSFCALLMVLCSSVSFAIAACSLSRAFCHSFSAANPNHLVHQSSGKAKRARHGLIKHRLAQRIIFTSRVRSQGGSSSGFGSGGGSSGSSGSLFGGGNDAQGLDGLCIGQRLERLERRLLLLLSCKPRPRSRGQPEQERWETGRFDREAIGQTLPGPRLALDPRRAC
jgi:hypothetical protein